MHVARGCVLVLLVACATTKPTDPNGQKPGTPSNPVTDGAICTATGDVCGADGVTNGDAETAYVCVTIGDAPVSGSKCTQGCSAGQCVTTATGDCPSGGMFCGGDTISGDASTLYSCPGAGLAPSAQQVCANGCSVQPAGTNDFCQPSQSCPGSGDYCGGDGVQGGDPNTLYHCPGSGLPPSSGDPCSMGCTIMPAGTNDFCSLTTACPTAGDYCGNDGLNGPSGVLFHCAAGGQAPTSWTTCDSGCIVEPQGQNDLCSGGACGTFGQAALDWETSQLNSGNSWSDYCLGFVNQAFQAAGDYLWWLQEPNANASLADAEGLAGFTWWNGSCPCGAILYWAANACNGEWGHIVICNGDGTVSTSGWPGYGGSTSASISWLDGQECGNTPTGYIVP